jgi:hypothetical protein
LLNNKAIRYLAGLFRTFGTYQFYIMNNSSTRIVSICTVLSFFAFSCDNSAKTTTTKTDSTATARPATGKPATGKLIGVWHDTAIHSDKGEQIAYELVTGGDKTYIQAITFIGKDLKLNDTPPITPSASELKKDGGRYTSVERPGETYQIDKNGDLLIYDGTELVATCKKLI